MNSDIVDIKQYENAFSTMCNTEINALPYLKKKKIVNMITFCNWSSFHSKPIMEL